MRKKTVKDENSKQSENVLQFRRDRDTLEYVADDLLDENDIEGALSTYLEIEESQTDYLLIRKIADLYTELAMFDYSINYWFKFIDCAPKRYHAEAYNALGGNYFFMRNDKLAAYYFNLQINDKNDAEFPFDEIMYELFDKNLSSMRLDEPPIHIYDAQNEKDRAAVEKALDLLESDSDAAKKLYESVKETSDSYGEARFYCGMIDLLELELDAALNEFLIAKKYKFREEVTLTYIFGLALYLDKTEIKDNAFKELKKEGSADFHAAITFFSLYEGFGKHKLAYEYAGLLEELFPNFGHLHFYYAIAAYNAKKYNVALDRLARYYKITNSGYVMHTRATVMDVSLHNTKFAQFEYIPALQRVDNAHFSLILDSLLGEKPAEIRKLGDMVFDIVSPCMYSQNPEICAGALQILSIINNEDAVGVMKDYLLKDDTNDLIKPIAITMLIEMGVEEPTGLVFNHIYSKIPFERVEFNDDCGDIFRSAYAFAFGRFVPYCEKEIYKLRVAAYSLYDQFLASGNIRKVKKVNTLAGLMMKRAGIKSLPGGREQYAYMGTSASAVNNLEKLLGE